MKWFKHISDSLDDPFIFDLMDRFGSDGYLVFFGILEIYSREFKSEVNWNLIVTRSQLRAKFHKRQDTLIMKCLKHIQNSGKWSIDIDDRQVTIFIPKFTEIIDEWTKRKLSSGSVVTPKKHKLNKKKEVRSKNKDNIYSVSFLNFSEKYPVKKSKAKAFESWQKLKRQKQLPDLQIILTAIENQTAERQKKISDNEFCPEWKHPSTWLNQHCWEDEVDKPITNIKTEKVFDGYITDIKHYEKGVE